MRKFVLAAAMVVAASGIASAQSGPNLIETRQVGFALLGGDFAGIRAVARAIWRLVIVPCANWDIPRLPGNPKNLLPTGGEAILLCS